MKEKRIYLKESGITLIALVVTIVVLLILAGVTINAVFSDSGIIKKAQNAQNKMNQAVENDLKGINELSNWLDGQTGTNDSIIIEIRNTEYSMAKNSELRSKGPQKFWDNDTLNKIVEILQAGDSNNITCSGLSEITVSKYNGKKEETIVTPVENSENTERTAEDAVNYEIIIEGYTEKKEGIELKIPFAALPRTGTKVGIIVGTEIEGIITNYALEGTVVEDESVRRVKCTFSSELILELQKGKNYITYVSTK